VTTETILVHFICPNLSLNQNTQCSVQESHLHIVPATSYILFEQSLAGWQSVHSNPYVHISGVSHYAATVPLGVQVIVDCHVFIFVICHLWELTVTCLTTVRQRTKESASLV